MIEDHSPHAQHSENHGRQIVTNRNTRKGECRVCSHRSMQPWTMEKQGANCNCLSQEDSKPTFTFEQTKHLRSSDSDTWHANANKIHVMFDLVREQASGNLKEANAASDNDEVHQIRVIFRNDTTEFGQVDPHPQKQDVKGTQHSRFQECTTELDLFLRFTINCLVSFCSILLDQSFNSMVCLETLCKLGANSKQNQKGMRHPQQLTCSSVKAT
jgi:hypothetical protein